MEKNRRITDAGLRQHIIDGDIDIAMRPSHSKGRRNRKGAFRSTPRPLDRIESPTTATLEDMDYRQILQRIRFIRSENRGRLTDEWRSYGEKYASEIERLRRKA